MSTLPRIAIRAMIRRPRPAGGMRRPPRTWPALVMLAATACSAGCADQPGASNDGVPPSADTTGQGGAAAGAADPTRARGAASDSMQVQVWLARGETVEPVTRTVAAAADTLRAALEALLAGPTEAEQAQGLSSWFSDATRGALRGARVADGQATVDLRDLRTVIPNASSSLGSTLLLDALNGTVFAASSADSVEYRFEGSCEAFGEFVQRGCIRYGRP